MLPAKVAIITRTKDRVSMLRRAINSVLSQDFSDWKHYIVNDGGEPDKVDELVSEYSSLYKGRVHVIHHPFSFTMEAASDAGIISGREEYIAIHDDDDSWEPEFLSATVGRLDQLSEDPAYGGVATQARVIVEREVEGELEAVSEHIFEAYEHVSFLDMLWRNRYPPICLVFRRVAMEQVGLFDTALHVLGDWDFHLRLYRQFKIAIIAKPLARYHHRPKAVGSGSNSVYQDANSHRVLTADYIDNLIRKSLDDGSLTYGNVMLHARTMDVVNRIEQSIHTKIEQAKSDIIWQLKQHIDWRLGKG